MSCETWKIAILPWEDISKRLFTSIDGSKKITNFEAISLLQANTWFWNLFIRSILMNIDPDSSRSLPNYECHKFILLS